MPSGSLAITKGTLWHRGGANRSDRPRLIITPQYCVGWVRQLENMALAVPAEMASQLPERARELIGYSIHPPFMGYVDGVHPEKAAADAVKVARGRRERRGMGGAQRIPSWKAGRWVRCALPILRITPPQYRAGLRVRIEHDALIALLRDVGDGRDIFRRAAVIDEVSGLAVFMARDVGIVAGEP